MKLTKAILLILLAIACMGLGQMMMGTEPGSVACTIKETFGDNNDTYYSCFENSATTFCAIDFDTSSAYTLTKADVYVEYIGDTEVDVEPEGTITAWICPDNSDEPACNDALCADDGCTPADATVLLDNFPQPGSPDFQAFVFSGGVSLSGSTKYWFVFKSDAPNPDEKTRIYIDTDGANEISYDNDATGWNQHPTIDNHQGYMRSYHGSCS